VGTARAWLAIQSAHGLAGRWPAVSGPVCKVEVVERHVEGVGAIAVSAAGAEADGAVRPVRCAVVSARVRARFVALYTREYPRVVAYARRRTGDLGSAEDVAAEVFRIAWERLGGGNEMPSTGWLFVTARNLLHSHYRSVERSTMLRHRLEQEREGGTEERPDDRAERVRDALGRLPVEQRELLIAHYWDDLSGADCAALVGCSVGAVWVRLHRARAALRRELQNLEDRS
jgi:RNA polymerase sigma-70 factor (ECF subfamily)